MRGGLAAVLFVLGLAAPAFGDAPAYAPGAPRDAAAFAFVQHPGALVPLDVPLTREDGQPTSLRMLAAGRPIVLALNYFHCPNLCGTVRDDLFLALERSGLGQADALVAAVSIDPGETSADARAARDAERPPAGAAFLTGDAGLIEEAVGFPSRRMDDRLILHPAGVVVLTPGGAVSRYLLGVGFQAGALEAAVRAAARGDVGPRANPILLLCFHFDPTTGRYTLAVMRVLQLGAGLTVLVVGGVLLLAHRAHPQPGGRL